MPTPTIPNGEEHFFPVVYSGNGQGQNVGSFVPFNDDGSIAKSCMFNSPDNPKLGKTFSGAGTNTTWTFSCWIKLGIKTSNGRRMIFSAGSAGSNYGGAEIGSTGDDSIEFYNYYGGSYDWRLVTNRQLEDTSKWYHLLFISDTTNSTESDRARIYIDGERVTSFSTESYPSLNYANNFWMGTTEHEIGTSIFTTQNFDGYMAEVNNVDGSVVLPSTFGLTNTSTGRWIPKTLSGITYGTNGFRFTFADSSALGDDTSGNTNDFTSSGLTASDQRTDTPTNNLPTMRPYNPSYNTTQAQGNLQYTPTGTNAGYPMCATLRPNSGKWYAEVRTSSNGGGNVITFGIYIQEDMHHWDNSYNYYPGGQISNGDGNGVGMQIRNDGNRWLTSSQLNGTVQNNLTGVALAAGDVIGIAVDVDNSLVTWYANDGSSLGSASILRPGRIMFTAMAVTSSDTFNWNFGDNPTFDGNETAGGNADGDGNGNFYHSVPTGFKMLRQDNMPTTDKGTSGLVWTKNRTEAYISMVHDSSRGPNKRLNLSADNPELSYYNMLNKFLKGGQQIGADLAMNKADNSFVSWNWVANGGTTSTNENGSITTTTQVNSTAGFSIIQYTGTEANATIGHGLSQTPDFILIKSLETHSPNGYWVVWHKDFAANTFQYFNTNIANDTSTTFFNNTLPTSSVINLGANFNTNMSGDKMICYAWHEVDGYSKFGSYSGNNSTDGPFIYTGFRPAFIMVKKTNATASWTMQDTTRDSINPSDKVLQTDLADAEVTGFLEIDFLSNGFKFRSADNQHNASGGSYIYFAFAEHPFFGDGTSPVTAR